MKYDVTLITPTGGRKYQMRLCEMYVRRQRLNGIRMQWIVVDDFADSTLDYQCTDIIHRHPFWSDGQNTLGLNILAALDRIESDICLFFEDDDWYREDYVDYYYSNITQHNYDIFGQGRAKYYNVRNGNHMIHNNTKHASLAQTGIKTDILIANRSIFEREEKFYDLHLWRVSRNSFVTPISDRCIGIKGMPGRAGIGMGHNRQYGTKDMHGRPMLQQWVGDDWRKYDIFFEENQVE